MEFRQFRITLFLRNLKVLLLNLILSDEEMLKLIKTNKQIGTFTETSLPLQKIETSRRLNEKIETARCT